MPNNETEIASLGEFGLIDRLTKDFPLKNDSSKKGVGDDAAVLSYGDKEVLVTTDHDPVQHGKSPAVIR